MNARKLSVTQAAAAIGVTPSRLRQKIRAGECTAVRIDSPLVGSGYYLEVPRSEVARLRSIPQTTGRPRKSRGI